MKSIRSRWVCWMALSALELGAVIGCSSVDVDQAGAELEPQATGRLRLPLVTSEGSIFRLRAASFAIRNASSTTVATLDSESDPTATELSVELSPGPYAVTLDPGWFLERLSDDGAEVVNAALVTPNPAHLDVRDELVTELVYTFATTDGVVTLGSGALSISVDVVRTEALATCTLVPDYYNDCPSGQTCLLADEGERTFCASPGPLPVGAACSSQQCVAGAQCLSQAEGEPTVCTAFCNPLAVTFGCNCASLGFDNQQIGICVAPPPNTCDLLTQVGCIEGEVCQYASGNFGTCGVPGTAARGDLCIGEVCAAGLDCVGDDVASQSAGRCMAFCDLENPSCEPPENSYYSSCGNVGTGRAGRCFDYF